MTPWLVALFGALGSALGGFLVLVGVTGDSTPEAVAGWAIGGLSGMALFVGLVAIGVHLGVEASDL